MFTRGINSKILQMTDQMMGDLAEIFHLGDLNIEPIAGWLCLEHTYTWEKGDYYYHPDLKAYYPIVRGVKVESFVKYSRHTRQVQISAFIAIRRRECLETSLHKSMTEFMVTSCFPPDTLKVFDDQLREVIRWVERLKLIGNVKFSTAGCGS